jgi:hypothetical protein
MPSKTDLYFTVSSFPRRLQVILPTGIQPEDNEIEVSHMRNAKLVVIDSVWGHAGEPKQEMLNILMISICASVQGNPADVQFINAQIRGFLRE